MSLRALSLLTIISFLALPAAAQDATATMGEIPGGPLMVNINYGANVPLTSVEPAVIDKEDALYRQSLLLRAETECAQLLATIATDCAMTGINISIQVNNYPGQVPALSVSSNVTLQVTLRETPAAP
jgi:hypothetical protein